MSKAIRVTRDVPATEDHNYSGRDVNEGEILYVFTWSTYGCIDEVDGIALSDKIDEYPFFEFPLDAIEYVES